MIEIGQILTKPSGYPACKTFLCRFKSAAMSRVQNVNVQCYESVSMEQQDRASDFFNTISSFLLRPTRCPPVWPGKNHQMSIKVAQK